MINKITIKWSYPVEYDTAMQSEKKNNIGLYYISRVFGGNETLLYIGKTIHSFESRLKSHKDRFIDLYRGKKYVRLGEVVEPKEVSPYELKGYINDAEKTIIFYIANEMKDELPENVTSKSSTCPDEDLIITNIGYRGVLPKELFISEQYNCD